MTSPALRLQQCDSALSNPKRLEAVARTHLIDTPVEKVFDRLANLASKLLNAPITIVSIIDDKKQFYKAAHGLPAPLDTIREVPIDGSLCRYTLAGESIVSPDVESFDLLKNHPTVVAFGVKAFISLPLIDTEGNVLGSFCAVDMKKRVWTEDQIYFLNELTVSVLTEIQLRQQIIDLENEKSHRRSFISALTHDLRTPLASAKLTAELLKRVHHTEVKTNERLDRIVRNIERGDMMIQDLLDMESLEASGKFPLTTAQGSLDDALKSTVQDMSFIWGDRFDLRIKDETSGVWDISALIRVFENLLSNAVKYGSEDTPVQITVSNIGIGKEKMVKIDVHNFGEVISEESNRNLPALSSGGFSTP
jgi:signal transduction histidine kinase